MHRLSLVVILIAWWPFGAAATQDDARLDPLFERLQATRNLAEARTIEATIWSIWVDAGDNDLDLVMEQGIAAMSVRRYQTALERFSTLIDKAPDFAEGWNKRATVYYLMGSFEASVLDIQRTLALEPRHFGALAGLGLIYISIDQPAPALRSFEAALAVNPHMPGARANAAEMRRLLDDRGI